MAIAVDPITQRKLLLVKQLCRHGIAEASHFSPSSRIVALICFDLSSESLMRAFVGAFDSSKTPADGFQSLVQQVESLLTLNQLGSLPDRANVLYVHSLRNDAQHKAKYPNDTDVSDARTYTSDFLRKFTLLAWTVDFEKMSLVDLVQHPRVKQFLIDAETALATSEFETAAGYAAAGLAFALRQVESLLVGKLPSFAKFLMVDSFGKPSVASGFDDPSRTLERMQRTLLHVALGLNYGDYLKVQQLAPIVQMSVSGNLTLLRTSSKTASKSEAEFVLAVATDAVLQIEARVGDIEKPFGSSDRWF